MSFFRLLFESVLSKVVKFSVLSFLIAWLLSCTSSHPYFNLPLAVVLVLAFHYLFSHLVLPLSLLETESRSDRRYRKFHEPVKSDFYYTEKPKNPSNQSSWKRLVNAPIVETAWESFCGNIIQEWIYDAWYCMMSPDREFPAEVRRLLNEAFGEVAQRARRVDLRTLLLRDMCDLFTEQLELYRSTKSMVGIVRDGDLQLSSKDRAFQQEMKTNKTLHAAFYSRDGHYRMIRRMSEGVISLIFSKKVVENKGVKAIARELLANCVLRQVVLYFTPYNANKGLLAILSPKDQGKGCNSKTSGNLKSSLSTSSTSEKMRTGYFEFEQRVKKSVILEEKERKQQKQKTKRAKSPHLTISKSHPNFASDEFMEANGNLTQENRLSSLNSSSSSLVDLKDALEETDLLKDESLDAMDASVSPEPNHHPTSTTSLPYNRVSFAFSEAQAATRTTTAMTDSNKKALLESAEYRSETPSNDIYNRQEPVEDLSFFGRPRANVVAPEINTNRGREYVVFKIRVADQKDQWTVTRRYRNFEALHKRLRDVPAYRELGPRLPPKRIFLPTHKTEVVEQRRVALDKYLQTILKSEVLAAHRDVWLFLSDQECRSFKPDVNLGLGKLIADNVDNARYQIKRKVVDSFLSQQSRAETRTEKALRGLEDSEDSSVAGSIKQDEDVNLQPELTPPFPASSSSPSIKVDSTLGPNNRAPSYESLSPFRRGLGAEKNSPFHMDQTKIKSQTRNPHVKYAGKAASTITSSSTEFYNPNENALPVKLGSANFKSRFEYQDLDAIDRQFEESPFEFPFMNHASSLHDGSYGTRQQTHECKDAHTNNRFGAEEMDNNNSNNIEEHHHSLQEQEQLDSDSSPPESEAEDYAGISAPLYEVADAIFNFPAQNLFRRQILQVVRQILSLLAGDAIDVYLNDKIMRLRSEHTIAWMIHSLKSLLWPGGIWFTSKSSPHCASGAVEPYVVSAISYLNCEREEADAKDVQNQLRVRLFRRAPAALVRLIGRNNYMGAVRDVYDMMQLKTFVRQIGYGVLEIGLLALFPELKELFARIHMEAKTMPESHS